MWRNSQSLRHRARLLAFVLPLTAATAASAETRELEYRFYVKGQPVGQSVVRMTQTPGALLLQSTTHVTLGPNTIDVSSTTELDPATYEVRKHSFVGSRGARPVAGEVHVKGDSAWGWTGFDERQPRSLRLKGAQIVVFDDWVMDHEIALARRVSLSTRHSQPYRILLAGSFMPSELLAGYTGEVAVEGGRRSAVARRLEVAIQGTAPFESHVDPETMLPLYLRFPQSQTEAFLVEFFGDNPSPRYAPPPSTPAGR